MLKKLLAGGILVDLSYVMATNAYANTIIPTTGVSWETSNTMQVLAGACGILVCLSRVVKTIAEAYLLKKKADALDDNREEKD